MSFSNAKDRQLYLLIVFWGLFLSALYAMNYKMHFDIVQMLDRGYSFVKDGVIVFHGNASSGSMGKIPGGLLSILVGFPMKIWNSPYSALALLAFLHLMALWLLIDVLKNYFSKSLLLLFVTIFWLSPWRVSEIYLWNPSYLFFAMALHFWSAYHMRETKRFGATFWHIFSIAFAFQIHNSSIILGFISLLLFYRKAIRVHWMAFAASTLIGVGSLVPYVMELMSSAGDSSVKDDDRYFFFRGLIYVYPMIKSVWYWVRFSATIFPRHIFQQIEMGWAFSEGIRWVPEAIWAVVKYFFGVSTTLYSIYVNFHFFKRNRKILKFWKVEFKGDEAWLAVYVAFTFLSVLFAAALSPIDLIHWHLIIVFPIALIPLLLHLKRKKMKGKLKNLLAIFFVYFSVYNILCALGSGKHSIDQDPQKDYIEMFKGN